MRVAAGADFENEPLGGHLLEDAVGFAKLNFDEFYRALKRSRLILRICLWESLVPPTVTCHGMLRVLSGHLVSTR